MTHTETYERGAILRILAENEGISRAIGMGLLLRTLDNLGISLSMREVALRLVYLEGKGYVTLVRRHNLTGWDRFKRGAGRPDDLLSARLTPTGDDLVERNIPADPGVAFEAA